MGEIFHFDAYGKREEKYQFLWDNKLKSVAFDKLPKVEPMYFMVQKDFEAEKSYQNYFSLNSLFNVNSVGVVTSRDEFVTDDDLESLSNRVKAFFSTDKKELKSKFGLRENKRWKIDQVQKDSEFFDSDNIRLIDYRPFDKKFIYFDSNFIERDRLDVVQHIFKGDNYNLVFSRQSTEDYWSNIQISKEMIDNRYHFSYKGIPNQAPLYLYPEESTQQTLDGKPERTPNLDKKTLNEISEKVGLKFTPENKESKGTFAPIDLLDYIYAVLHSPSYREKYKEFLKIDFPRVPYPEDPDLFWQLVELGGELRQIHLLEHPVIEEFITTYPIAGSNVISNRLTKTDPGFIPEDDDETTGKVWINDEQYFGNMPKKAWEFYIGGYQPAEKWLKDRRDRELSIDEIRHYQKIIVALVETDRLMQEVDGVLEV